ncbi:MAG: hypothetical protein COB15_10265 [Flavobacteriales bacterium]|nr:MAG: hypothetical protein COB15_10265 [Flavobacteriales bacterium]
MKAVTRIVFVGLIGSLLLGCSKDHDNSLRIVNNLYYEAKRVRFGDLRFENLPPQTSSPYQSVAEGVSEFTAIVSGGMAISEPITIKGDYVHKWTITIISETKVSLTRDQ